MSLNLTDEVVEKFFKEEPRTDALAKHAVRPISTRTNNNSVKITTPNKNKKKQKKQCISHLQNVPDFWFADHDSPIGTGDRWGKIPPPCSHALHAEYKRRSNTMVPMRTIMPLPFPSLDEETLSEDHKAIDAYTREQRTAHKSSSSQNYNKSHNKKKWSKSEKRSRYGPQSGLEDDPSTCLHPAVKSFLNKIDVVAAQLYIMSRLGDDVPARILSVHSMVRTLFPHETDLTHVYKVFTDLVTPVAPQAGVESWSASLKEMLTNWKLLKSHPLGNSISTLLSACVILGLIGPGRFKFSIGDLELFSKSVKAKQVSAVDVLDAMVETVVYFFEVGHAILETRSLTPLLFMTQSADALSIEVSFLKANAAMANNGSLASICPDCTVEQYRERLAACLEKLNNCVTALAKGSYERFVLQRKYEELDAIQSKFLASQAASCQRLRPYAGMVYASSGVGKTTFVRDSIIYALAANGFDSSDDKIITVSDTDKYDSTLRSDIEGIIDDDVANQKPKFAPMSAAARIINIVNSKPYAANMAAVEDKGKVSCNAKMYFLSTNHPTLDAYETSNCPSSVLCRFQVCVAITVKPEFCTDTVLGTIGMQLDSNKVFAKFGEAGLEAEPHELDVWNITVTKPFVKPAKKCGEESIGYDVIFFEERPMTNVSYDTYLRFLCHDTQRYFANQRKLLERSLNVTDRISKCFHGLPCIAHCNLCAVVEEEEKKDDPFEPQSGAMIGTTLGWFARSWFNGIIKKIGVFAVGEIRQIEFATTQALFAFCKEWQQSIFTTWTDYIPDSCINTFLGKYAIRRAIKMGNAREILIFRTCTLLLMASLVANIWQRRALCMFHIIALSLLVYIYKVFVVTINATLERELMARRDAISDASRAVRETYIAKAIKYVGFAGIVYTSVCVIREFIKAGRQVTNGVVFAPFGVREHAHVPTTVKVVNPNGEVMFERTLPSLRLSQRIDEKVFHPQTCSHDPHGNLIPQSPEEVLARSQEVNIYKRTFIDALTVDSRVATSTTDDVVSRLHKHLVHISVAHGDKWRVTNGVIVAPRVLMIPFHILFDNLDSRSGKSSHSYTCKVTRRSPDTVGGEFTNRFFMSDVYRIPNCDLCLVHMPCLGTARNFSYLLLEKGSYSGPCRLVYRNLQGEISEFASNVASPSQVEHHGSNPFSGGYSHVIGGTFNGLCVSPYVSQGRSPAIVGFHLGGISGLPKGIYGSLSKFQLDDAIQALALQTNTTFDVQSGVLPSHIMGATVLTGSTIHQKCPTQYMDAAQCDINVYGSCVGKATFRPTIRTSIMSPFIEKHCGVPQKWGNPCTHPWKFERLFLENCGNPAIKVDSQALLWAASDWTNPIIDWAKKMGIKYDRLGDIATVSGMDGIKWVDPINKNSAIGFPLSGKKRDYLVRLDSDEWPEWQEPYSLGPELAEEKARILDCYSRNERAYPVFKSCPKSESIPLTKEKKRLFQVAPTGYQVIVRQFFLPIAVLMGHCPLLSECSVGINCASDEWEQMAAFLEKFPSDNTIAGDYKAYDQMMGPDVTRKAWECLIDLAVGLGASESEAHIMRCIVADMVNPLLAFEGTLIELKAGNPSGQNLTAHLNCVVNSLLLRIVWWTVHREQRKTVVPFREGVSLQVYGDDNLATTNNKHFNMASISRILGEAGYIYTDAQKNLEVVPFIKLCDAEYLKRKSVYHPKLRMRVGALSQDSIFKSLHCFDSYSKISPQQHAVAVAESALFEFFLHGEEIFEMRRAQLFKAYEEAGLAVPLLFKDYTARALDFLEQNSLAFKVTTHGTAEAACKEDVLHCSKAEGFTLMGLLSGDTREPGNCFKNNGSEDSDSSLQGLAHSLNAQELDGSKYGPQSGTATHNVSSQPDVSWHQTLQYNDGDGGIGSEVAQTMRSDTIGGDCSQLPLSDFFKRPVLIQELLWESGQELLSVINPWSLFFTHPRVANRISNYSRLRASLKVKITVTGNGFYYGRALVSYVPLQTEDSYWIFPPEEGDYVEHTQRPHLFLNPTTSEGGEMHLPFFFYHEAFDIVTGDVGEAGQLYISDMCRLAHTNGFGGPVKVSIFAWSDDVELSVPTSKNSASLQPQSGEVPISPFAKGSDLSPAYGASRSAFTNVLVDHRPTTTGPLANSDVPSCATKLSLMKDQEVTVDTRVMGLAGDDELNIRSIATRQAFLTQSIWTPYQQAGTILFSSAVHPGLVNFGDGEKAAYHFTPMSNMAQLFSMWRGTIKFRFVVVGSSYHRGRLKISWDPNFLDQIVDLNTAYHCIVDIGEQTDFGIEVGWGARTGMLECCGVSKNNLQYSRLNEAFGVDPTFSNGVLRLEVFDLLTQPSDSFSDIQVMVFVSAGDDIEFAAPRATQLDDFTVFPQSGEVAASPDDTLLPTDNMPDSDNVIAHFATAPGNMEKALSIYAGEKIVSLRTLLQRVAIHAYNDRDANGTRIGSEQVTLPTFPYLRGKDSLGFSTQLGHPYSFCNTIPLQWVLLSFVGYRGAIRVHNLELDTTTSMYSFIHRCSFNSTFYKRTHNETPSGKASQSMMLAFENSINGFAGNHISINPSVEVEIPYQNYKKFLSARRTDQLSPEINKNFQYFSINRVGNIDNSQEQLGSVIGYSAGKDFQVGFFLGLPRMYLVEENYP